jgi:3-dehydroquinate dehydratase/shikimate dehydrogenase
LFYRMKAKVCVTVTGATMAELRAHRDEVADADLVELRLDTVRDPDAAGALEGRRSPVIVTCRPAWEGGLFRGAEEERRRLLREALDGGAEYVDVEWKAGFTDLIESTRGRRIVLSHHRFDAVPIDLAACATAMRSTGAEVIKLAVMARRLTDCLQLLPLADGGTPAVLLAMGEAGVASRILATRFGSSWTYAGDCIAPGQMTKVVLDEQFSFDSISDQTAVYGVIGRPVMHSVSPAIHNAAFAASGVDAVYLPLAAADFEDFLRFANDIGVRGASVTAPFKVDAFRAADEAEALGERIGSVNTLKRVGDRWLARTTDVEGFLTPLESRFSVKGQRATVLGAGGAARAVVEALREAGAHVSIAARKRERAETLARTTGALISSWPPASGSWDVLINATPVGTAPNTSDSPLPDGPFSGELVYDLVYNPAETRLLRDARAAGCRTLGGLDMLITQAARQFEWWTGERAPVDVMRDAAIRALDMQAAHGA